jgi:pyridoxal phosphate enzyme (YggS family)
LLREINKQAAKNERVINCLLQVFIAEEDSKTGMDENELPEALAALSDLPNVKVVGLMGISTFTDNKEVVTREFRHLKKLYDEGKGSHSEWNVLSMGMSGDWQMATEEGSTLIRVGTSIFGARK